MKQGRSKKVSPSGDECREMSHDCLSSNLRRTERLVTRHYDAHLAKSGISAVQLPILGIVAVAGEPTFRLLSDELALDRSTLSRNLSVLERNGILTIGPSSGPKPGKIALTAKGRSKLSRAHALWRDAEELSAGIAFLRNLRRGARQ